MCVWEGEGKGRLTAPLVGGIFLRAFAGRPAVGGWVGVCVSLRPHQMLLPWLCNGNARMLHAGRLARDTLAAVLLTGFGVADSSVVGTSTAPCAAPCSPPPHYISNTATTAHANVHASTNTHSSPIPDRLRPTHKHVCPSSPPPYVGAGLVRAVVWKTRTRARGFRAPPRVLRARQVWNPYARKFEENHAWAVGHTPFGPFSHALTLSTGLTDAVSRLAALSQLHFALLELRCEVADTLDAVARAGEAWGDGRGSPGRRHPDPSGLDEALLPRGPVLRLLSAVEEAYALHDMQEVCGVAAVGCHAASVCLWWPSGPAVPARLVVVFRCTLGMCGSRRARAAHDGGLWCLRTGAIGFPRW
jgi:hypothetical protein